LPSLASGFAVGGSEGVGIVTERGKDATGPREAKVGDVVVPVKANLGWWGEEIVCGANEVQAVPLPSGSAHLEKLATLSVCFSTAYRLLHSVDPPLKRGDSFIQNGSTSAVGQSLIQLGRLRGIRSINLIREGGASEDSRRHLEALGADVVTTASEAKRDSAGMPPPRAGFNCVGGDLSAAVAKRLAKNATLVTYGGMSKKPVQIPTPLSIFKGIRATGFWLSGQWYPDSAWEERQEMFEALCGHVARGELEVRTQTFPLEEALRAFTPGEVKPNHKLVLKMN